MAQQQAGSTDAQVGSIRLGEIRNSAAGPADAQLILQLYDLRRESEMRKARNWYFQFNPQSAQDVLNMLMAAGSQENAWFRQVLGYWDMVASLALRGALHPDLFFDNCGEMWFTFAKLRPYAAEVREKLHSPEFLARVEKAVLSTEEGRERLTRVEQRIAMMRQRAAAQRNG